MPFDPFDLRLYESIADNYGNEVLTDEDEARKLEKVVADVLDFVQNLIEKL